MSGKWDANLPDDNRASRLSTADDVTQRLRQTLSDTLPSDVFDEWRAALMYALAPVVTDLMRQAWDEGYGEGDSDQYVGAWPKAPNPYAVTGGDNDA